MGLGNLTNCSRCGGLFVKVASDFCPKCLKGIEEDYLKCAEYLRDNKLINVYDLSEATEVSVKQITRFIKEGRISISDFPNMSYSCDSCGEPIQSGKLCKSCSDRLNKEIKHTVEKDATEKEAEKASNTYYQIKDRFK